MNVSFFFLFFSFFFPFQLLPVNTMNSSITEFTMAKEILVIRKHNSIRNYENKSTTNRGTFSDNKGSKIEILNKKHCLFIMKT
ncbi:hypothetical protein ABFX02_04G223000 [Erythranthe guttata]